MGIYIEWLADAARLTGYPVVEVGGWRGRGHGGMRVGEGVTGHHTADGPAGDYPSLNIVRDGRAGLAGPLSQLGLGRSGTIYVIAAGLAYHAGASAWAGYLDLNDEFLGIEAESTGVRDDWTPQQRDAYPRLVAALLFYMRRDAGRFAGHREVCRPAGRKIDPAFWDLNAFRDRVEWLLGDPLRRIPRFATPPPRPFQEDDVQNFPISGTGRKVLICPTGDAAASSKRQAWLSAAVLDGTGSIRVFAQGDQHGIHDWWWNEQELATTPDNHVKRLHKQLQNNVTHLIITWDLTKAKGGGVLCLETKPQT